MKAVTQVRGGPNDVVVNFFVDNAWAATVGQSKGRLDKSKRPSIVPPLDVVRDVIFAAKRSGYAFICSVPDGTQRNYRALVAHLQRSSTWTDDQIIFFRWLHFAVVATMTGNIEYDPSGFVASTLGDFRRRPSCDASFKEAVARRIEIYERAR